MDWTKFWTSPCLQIVVDDEEKPKVNMFQQAQVQKLIEQNRELKRQLESKRAKAIEAKWELLE